MKISVIGAGSWGSALAELASRCGHEVMLWAHDASATSDGKPHQIEKRSGPNAPFTQCQYQGS